MHNIGCGKERCVVELDLKEVSGIIFFDFHEIRTLPSFSLKALAVRVLWVLGCLTGPDQLLLDALSMGPGAPFHL